MSKPQVKIGIIGGSGVYSPEFLDEAKEITVETPFGSPSDVLLQGTVDGVPCIVLSRHGRKHQFSPTNVNYRANIWAMKECGVTHIIATTACGSLKEELCPGDIVFLDQFIDRTTKRQSTFYDGKSGSPQGVCHIPLAHPFCHHTTQILIASAEKLGIRHHRTGTCVTEEGPRFSTKAENIMFQIWGGDVINMTTVPEVALANELGMCYSSIALVTDYGGWKDNEVSVDAVLAVVGSMVKKAGNIILHSVKAITTKDWSDILAKKQESAKLSVMG